MLSVIIPAYNEERYLPATLAQLGRAAAAAGSILGRDHEIIVADNASTDRTAALAREAGATVVPVAERNIARARNAGAATATATAAGDLLLFLDADTLVPINFLDRVRAVMADPGCLGGAVDTDYRPARWAMRLYLDCWRWLARALHMAQGPAQFCRPAAFAALGGYDEAHFMGEDVDFYWRLRALAHARGQHVCFLRDIRVVPSCRRFDQWPTWRVLIQTNPVWITLFQYRAGGWPGWYRDPPR